MDSQKQDSGTPAPENDVLHESQDTNTKADTDAGDLNASEDVSKQAQLNLKVMEAALKAELRSIHTLVGRKLDIKNSKPLAIQRVAWAIYCCFSFSL